LPNLGALSSHRPVVSDGVCKVCPVPAEVTSGHRRREFLRGLVLTLVILVPRGVDAVAAERSKRVVFLVKREVIDRVALPLFLDLVLSPMALETEVIFLALV
jgi:hypothetical protein